MIFESVVVGELEVNCFVLACEQTREGIIVDPGDQASDILNLVESNRIQVVEVVATYGHFDHIGRVSSVVEKTGAPFSIHRDDLFMVEGLVDIAAFFGMKTDPPLKIDRFISEGDTIRFGQEELGVIHVPGHAPGNVALVWPGHAIVGDSIFAGSVGRTDLEGSDPDVLMASIRKKILTLSEDTQLYPGHGPFTTVGEEIRSNLFLR